MPEMQTLLVVLALAGQTIPAIAVAGPATLQPSGKWTVEYNDKTCVLQRSYGTGEQLAIVGFRPLPLSKQAEVVLLAKATDKGAVGELLTGKGQMTLGAEQRTVSGYYKTWRPRKQPDDRVTTFDLYNVTMEEMGTADRLTFSTRQVPAISIAPRANATAFAALKTCQDDLLKTWGIDPTAIDGIGTWAKGDPAAWITSDDYPDDAIRAEFTGRTTLLWAIGVDGRVTNCRTVVTSGVPSLDKAGCVALTARARYTPALDKSGEPVVSYGTRTVIWALPGD